MHTLPSFAPFAGILGIMALFALIETIIPLRSRTQWSYRHLVPNLALTFITFTTNFALNMPILLGLAWLNAHNVGLLHIFKPSLAVGIFITVVTLDFAWYLTHRLMHKVPLLWRLHAIHHSDLIVDVTTTIRQHPGEGVIRYAFMAVFAFSLGASPAAFAIYRLISAMQGMFEHANIKLPPWLDTAIAFVTPSPNMHKVHHSTNRVLTDSNYSNIFSIWDRLFGSFTPPHLGRNVDYGLDDDSALPERQSTLALLSAPFRK